MIGVMILVFFVLLALSVPVAHVLVIASGSAILYGGELPVMLAAQQMVSQTLSFPMLALPFFIFSGTLMMSGRLGEKLIGFATELVQRYRGGLGSVSVVGSCVFGGASGSAVADASALGSMLIPWQKREGYPAGFCAAINASSSTISILIPPSIPFILYSLVSDESIADLFLAGIVPGLLLAAGFIAVCNISARLRGFPLIHGKFDARRTAILFVQALPALAMPVMIIVLLRFGFATPTEVSVIAVLYALFAGVAIYRDMTFLRFCQALITAGTTTGVVMLVIMGSAIVASDLGNGRFDGAWLVQNFENLNPANTLWSKQYNLYSKVDTEASRYLGFEKWWGGHVFLNGPEIQYIVDNLFIGNRLATAGLVTSDGIRIDLRNIRSPIIVFCSKGDNITPPPQALGWIPDLYQDDAEVVAHGQTIVYAVHESIGHLGIFVSGSVARKEHQEFTANIDLIDVLPAGIYQAEIADKTPDTLNADLAAGDYVLSFARRKVDDVRAIVARNEEDDRRFAAVARISDINLGLYRSFLQPWVRAAVTPQSAEWMQRLHPLRLPYELISDRNPWVAPVAQLAAQARLHRQPAAPDNPYAIMERMASDTIEAGLNMWQELRDALGEQWFMNIYGSPLVQDWAGLGAKAEAPRKHPGVSPEHRRFMDQRADELRALMDQGGVREAAMRMLLYVAGAEGSIDERSFAMLRQMRADADSSLALQEFKDVARDQALMMRLDGAAALQAMPRLLEQASADDIRNAFGTMRHVLQATGPLNERARACLDEMEQIFRAAAQRALKRVATAAKPAPRKSAAARRRPAGKPAAG